MNTPENAPSADADGFVDVANLALRVSALETKVAGLTDSATVATGIDPDAVIKAVQALEGQHGA